MASYVPSSSSPTASLSDIARNIRAHKDYNQAQEVIRNGAGGGVPLAKPTYDIEIAQPTEGESGFQISQIIAEDQSNLAPGATALTVDDVVAFIRDRDTNNSLESNLSAKATSDTVISAR